MTREQYHRLAPAFNRQQHRKDQLIAQIPQNINRAGKTYRKLLAAINTTV